MDNPNLVSAARSALSTLQYIERELKALHEVLPELQPARRCLYALAGEVDKLSAALPELLRPIAEPQRTFIASVEKSIAFHRSNSNDPCEVSNAVIAALEELKTASMAAYRVEASGE